MPTAVKSEVTTESDVDILNNIDLEQERRLSESVNMEAVRDYGVLIDNKDEVSLEKINEIVPVPLLPSFPFGDLQYVLLTDLQNVFGIREDYCLAIIAQNLEAEKDFLDKENDKYCVVDSAVKDSEYLDAASTLSMIYADSRRYERTLPTEEEFSALQIRLGIDKMGRDREGGSTVASSSVIDLWNKHTLVEDENQQLHVDDDPYLLRARGIRAGGKGKDSALSHFIPHLRFPEFLCLHHKFSQPSTEFTIFALKVLSRYLGGYPVRMNTGKIMLLEKQTAINIFGQGPGVNAMRSNYYLAYAAYGLACGIKDPSQLSEYGKREMLRYGRARVVVVPAIQDAAESSASRERLHTEDLNEDPTNKRPRII